MKKNHTYIILFLFSSLLIVCCKKERIIYKTIQSDIKKTLNLEGFFNTRQGNSLNTVRIIWSDTDTSNLSYNTNLLDTTGLIIQNEVSIKEVTHINLKSNYTYRQKVYSIPKNDSLIIRFRIGTTGDVDIQRE